MRDGAGALAIKGQDGSPSCPSKLLVGTLTLISMNLTFKVARPGAQLNIIAYTGPPPPKPRRLSALIRREEAMEENSLLDLSPNVVFDELDARTRQELAAADRPATFVSDLYKASASFV